MPMNPAVLSALAALSGSAIGSLGSVLSSYVLQSGVTRRKLLNRQLAQREALYSSFITDAARLYADAMTHKLESISEMVGLFAVVSRIRLVASEPVIQAADDLLRRIVKLYGEQNLTVEDLRTAALSERADPLAPFSHACRLELRDILRSKGVGRAY